MIHAHLQYNIYTNTINKSELILNNIKTKNLRKKTIIGHTEYYSF